MAKISGIGRPHSALSARRRTTNDSATFHDLIALGEFAGTWLVRLSGTGESEIGLIICRSHRVIPCLMSSIFSVRCAKPHGLARTTAGSADCVGRKEAEAPITIDVPKVFRTDGEPPNRKDGRMSDYQLSCDKHLSVGTLHIAKLTSNSSPSPA
jgi:hypothetical protein